MPQEIHQHPGQIIYKILMRKKQLNKKFSLRALAQKLDLSPGNLSQVISGKRGLSEKKAQEICKTLDLSKEEKAAFLTSLNISKLKNVELRERLQKTFIADVSVSKRYSSSKSPWEDIIESFGRAIITISSLKDETHQLEAQKTLLRISSFLYQLEFKSNKNKINNIEIVMNEIDKKVKELISH
jgi:plasmid maintenance system antidote protein VapI